MIDSTVKLPNNPVNYVDPSGHKKKIINITRSLENKMMKNARILRNKIRSAVSSNIVRKTQKIISVFKFFYNKVKTRGEWDLKNKRAWKFNPKKEVFKYANKKLYRTDDVGNIHFGFVGAVLFKREFLCAGAGVYQVKSGTSKWKYALSYGDDPHDTKMIRYGYSLYQRTNKTYNNNKYVIFKPMLVQAKKHRR